jgi:hypothetical protein
MKLDEVCGEHRAKELKEEIGYALQTLMIYVNTKDLRNWTEFFAVFKPPQWNSKHLGQRVLTNLIHYRTNYILIVAGIFGVRLVFAPFMLLSLVCVGAFCFYFLVILNKPIVINDNVTLTTIHKQAVCGLVSALFLVLSGSLEKLLWTMLYCLLIIVSHMVFRPRSVTSKTGKLYDELKLSGFSWFSAVPEGDREIDPENPASDGEDGVSPFLQQGVTSASVRKRPGQAP